MFHNGILTVLVLSIATAGIGITTLLGYALHKVAIYQWAGDAAMAFNTAVAILLLSLATFIMGWCTFKKYG